MQFIRPNALPCSRPWYIPLPPSTRPLSPPRPPCPAQPALGHAHAHYPNLPQATAPHPTHPQPSYHKPDLSLVAPRPHLLLQCALTRPLRPPPQERRVLDAPARIVQPSNRSVIAEARELILLGLRQHRLVDDRVLGHQVGEDALEVGRVERAGLAGC